MKAALDLHSPEFLRDPGTGLAGLRAEAELVRMKLPILGNVWVTTTYDATRAVLSDAENFVRNPANAGGKSLEQVVLDGSDA